MEKLLIFQIVVIIGFIVFFPVRLNIVNIESSESIVGTMTMKDEVFQSSDIFRDFNESYAKLKVELAQKVAIEKYGKELLEDGMKYAILDVSEQRDYVFVEGELYDWYMISTGEWSELSYDSKTYPNVWKIAWRADGGLDPLYGSCLLGLDVYSNGGWVKTGRALHGTETPEIIGTPLSLGCAYHRNSDIEKVCEVLDIGDYVISID